MFEGLEIFQLAGATARHAAARQAVVAQNIANADTPGYRARDVADFAETWRAMTAENREGRGEMPMRMIDAERPHRPMAIPSHWNSKCSAGSRRSAPMTARLGSMARP